MSVHVTPLPEYPALHAHVNEPTVLAHVALVMAQLCVGNVRSVHSPPTIRPPPSQLQHASFAVYTTRYCSWLKFTRHQF